MDTQKKKQTKSESVQSSIYEKLPLSDLVLYSIFSLQNQQIETNFENIVVESFELFPEKFSMQIYTEYPNPNRVRRELQRMDGRGFQVGDEQYVDGNLKTTYKFTDKGLKRLTQIQTQLKTGKEEKSQIKSKVKDSRGKIGRVLNEVEKNPLFKKFQLEGENIEISEPLVRDLLFATMETSDEKLRNNMKTLIDYCDVANRQNLKIFLIHICKKFSNIF